MRCLVNRSPAPFCCSGNLFRLGRPSLRRFALTALTAVRSECRGCNLTGKGYTVCAGARNLGSFVLDDVLRRRKDSSSGFHAAGWWLNSRPGSLQQRTLRQNGQSLLSSSSPEGSAASFCDFSSDFHSFGNAHAIELGESPHHSLQLCVHEIPVVDQLISRVLGSGTGVTIDLVNATHWNACLPARTILHVLASMTDLAVSCR